MNVALGRQLNLIALYLAEDSAFADTITRNTDWTDPPVIEFNDGDETWTTILDPDNPKVAVITETRTTVAARSNGDKWRLRDVTSDEVLAKGTVVMQATS